MSNTTYKQKSGNYRKSWSKSKFGSKRGDSRGSRGSRGSRRKNTIFNPSQYINKNPGVLSVDKFTPQNNFSDFGLDKNLLETVKRCGISEPTPIQDSVIPEILKGRDVVGLAETGTGKTAAFLLPLIQRTLEDKNQQTLIIAPTRELAIQINDELRKLAKQFKIFSTVCVGGASIYPQVSSLRKVNHFIIGTPGRIMDHIKRKNIDTRKIKNVVLDEADRMLDMGFIQDIKDILKSIPEERNTLFFSATMDSSSSNLVNDFLKDPVKISVKKKDISDYIYQDVVGYGKKHKFDTLRDLLTDVEFKKVIIFGEMKHSVQKLADELNSVGVTSESIHGNKSHSQRQRALKSFKEGRVRVLVATDVAARGIHVDGVSHVINYDLPQTFEDYTHRIGRTGRGNNFGKALTFVSNRK